MRSGGFCATAVSALVALLIGVTEVRAEETVAVELNKIEQQGDACRVYMLFENKTGQRYETFRLDLVLFDGEGVIARRIALDASPLRSDKSVVKLFDLTGLDCGNLSRILLNDVEPCSDEGGARRDCVELTRVSSRAGVGFYK